MPRTICTRHRRGFIESTIKELPMEYAVEMNRLIELQMEGSIG
jgi:Fe-S cluster assembly protein SufB